MNSFADGEPPRQAGPYMPVVGGIYIDHTRSRHWGEYVEVRVEDVDDGYVLVRPLRRPARRSRVPLSAFKTKRFAHQGYDGEGIMPAWEGYAGNGCLSCGDRPTTLPLDSVLGVGFGFVEVTRDGEMVWGGDSEETTLAEFDQRAEERPGDWRVAFHGPMSDRYYQRQGPGKWVMYRRGMGFA